MKTYIQETIARLRELDQTASPAPWEAWGFGEDEQTSIEHPMGDVLERGERGYGHMREDITWLRESDADLITETRNAIPVLLAEIDRLTAEIDRLTDENTQLLETAAEVWAEGYLDKEAEAGGVMIHSEPRERAENPYKKDN